MSTGNYINIAGVEISYTDARIDINKLKFYDKNPRVLSKLKRAGNYRVPADQLQSVITREMEKEPSVQTLLRTIPKEGGVMEHLIVQQSTLAVLEGNSRLAALRILANKYEDELSYLTAPCHLVELKEDQIDALLDEYHVEGKTSWTAFDKAYISYQRVVLDGVAIEDYAKRTSATKNEIGKRIAVIQLMINEGMDLKPDMFSYYEVIVRSNKLQIAFAKNPKLKAYLLNELKKEEPAFKKALDMRDHIPQIADKPKLLKRLIDGTVDFDLAKEQAKPTTPKKHVANALGCLKEVTKRDLDKLNTNECNILRIEMKKCRKEVQRIDGILNQNRSQ